MISRLSACASHLVGGGFRHFASEQRGHQLQQMIREIEAQPKFQASPKKYIVEWVKKRGPTEEFRLPEDLALSYFKRKYLGMRHEQTDKTYLGKWDIK